MKEEDEAIAAYRAALTDEAVLAGSDLDEIEDHLRTLAAELRESGLPAGGAIAEAARRLGAPREVAREHVRVRSAFGARLSRVRAWSATVMLAPVLAVHWQSTLHTHFPAFWINAVVSSIVLAGLAARATWARPVVMAGLVLRVLWALAVAPVFHISALYAALDACCFAGLLFVMPWRRGEIGVRGWALALLVFAYSGADGLFGIGIPPAVEVIAHSAAFAWAAVALAGIGVMLGARWAALVSAVAAIVLGMSVIAVTALSWGFQHATMFRVNLIASGVLGVAAASACAVISLRAARSAFGSLRDLLPRA